MFEYITNLLEGHVVPSLKLAVQQNDKVAIAECSSVMRRCSDVMLNIEFNVERVLSALTYTNTSADVAIRELARCKCIALYIEEGVSAFTVRNEYTPHNELVGIELQWAEDDEEKFMVLYKKGKVTEMPLAFKPMPPEKEPAESKMAVRKVISTQNPDKPQMSIARSNMLSDVNYRPYCGNPECHLMARSIWTGEQFKCRYCNWESKLEPEFIALYKETHKL